MDGCESGTIKKAECWRIDAFELWCWSRRLKVPWTARRSDQSILEDISPEYSLGGLMLKLKLQYSGHLVWRTDWLGKPPMLRRLKVGGEGDDGGWDGWIASPTRWAWVWASSRSWWWTGKHAAVHGVAKSRTQLSNWTELWGRGYQEEVLGTQVPCLHGLPVDSEREPQAGLARLNSPPYCRYHLYAQPNQGRLLWRMERGQELWAVRFLQQLCNRSHASPQTREISTHVACYWFYLPNCIFIKSTTQEGRITIGRKKEAAFPLDATSF